MAQPPKSGVSIMKSAKTKGRKVLGKTTKDEAEKYPKVSKKSMGKKKDMMKKKSKSMKKMYK